MTVNIILILLIVLLAAGGIVSLIKRFNGESCCSGGPSEVKVQVQDKNKKNYKYTANLCIEGMKCKNCALRIQNKLNSLNGVWAKVNFKNKTAQLLLKQNNFQATIQNTIEAAGYSVNSYTESEVKH